MAKHEIETSNNECWWEIKDDETACSNSRFAKYYYGFVIHCPVSIKTTDKKKNLETFINVSARFCSFRDRKITGGLLYTLNAQIKKLFPNTYFALEKDQGSVEEKVRIIEANNKDKNVELMVLKKRSEMSDTEAVFYSIRNAIAHGSFEIRGSSKKRCYLFETKKKMVNCRIRVYEEHLKALLRLSNMTEAEVRDLRKNSGSVIQEE